MKIFISTEEVEREGNDGRASREFWSVPEELRRRAGTSLVNQGVARLGQLEAMRAPEPDRLGLGFNLDCLLSVWL